MIIIIINLWLLLNDKCIQYDYYPSSLSLLRFGLGLLLEPLISYLSVLGPALMSNSLQHPLKEHIKNASTCLLLRKYKKKKKTRKNVARNDALSSITRQPLQEGDGLVGAIKSWWELRISRANFIVGGTGEMPNSIWVHLDSLPLCLELIQCHHADFCKIHIFLQNQFLITVTSVFIVFDISVAFTSLDPTSWHLWLHPHLSRVSPPLWLFLSSLHHGFLSF